MPSLKGEVSSAEGYKGADKIKQGGKTPSKGITVKGGEEFMHTAFPSPGHGHKFENLSLKKLQTKREIKTSQRFSCISHYLNTYKIDTRFLNTLSWQC